MTEKNAPITTIGFEGEHQSGKGTQIEKLVNELEEKGIPVLVVKGDGRKPLEGEIPVPLDTKAWNEINKQLSSEEATKQDWNEAAYRLARELLVARDRVLPKLVEKSGASSGVLIVDRTVLSRGVVVDGNYDQLYTDEMRPVGISNKPKGKKISPEDVFPSIVFNIQVPPEIALERVSNDEDNALRRKHILANEGKYGATFISNYLPQEFQNRIIEIDGTDDEEKIHNQILEVLNVEKN